MPGCENALINVVCAGPPNQHDDRPVHLIITMIKWIRTSRLSIKNSLSQVSQMPGSMSSAPVAGLDMWSHCVYARINGVLCARGHAKHMTFLTPIPEAGVGVSRDKSWP